MNIQEGQIVKGALVLDILPSTQRWGGNNIRLKCKCGHRFRLSMSLVRSRAWVDCDSCKTIRNRKLIAEANKKNPRHTKGKLPEPDYRHCNHCHLTMPVGLFRPGRNECKECYRIVQRKRQIKYNEKKRAKNILNKGEWDGAKKENRQR